MKARGRERELTIQKNDSMLKHPLFVVIAYTPKTGGANSTPTTQFKGDPSEGEEEGKADLLEPT